MSKAEELFAIAQELYVEMEGLPTKGKKIGDCVRLINKYMEELQKRAEKMLGGGYAEKKARDGIGLRPDYYFPGEQTVVELAFGLNNPNSEFEKDILKALLLAKSKNHVGRTRLVIISRPGGKYRCKNGWRGAFMEYAKEHTKLDVEIRELQYPAAM